MNDQEGTTERGGAGGRRPPPTAGRRRNVKVFREAGGERVIADVPRVCSHYSPPSSWGVMAPGETGYDCGPFGDAGGKLELALNVLNDFVPPGSDGLDPVRCGFVNVASATAFSLHDGFREAFIDAMEHDGGTILAARVLGFIDLYGFAGNGRSGI